jgi:hypothetical protein
MNECKYSDLFHSIKFLRVSSEMFPFASHAKYGYKLDYAASELKVCHFFESNFMSINVRDRPLVISRTHSVTGLRRILARSLPHAFTYLQALNPSSSLRN